MGAPRVWALAACAILACAGAGCGDDDSSSNGTLEQIAKADDDQGVRFTIRGTLDEDGKRTTLRGYGQAEAKAKATRIVFSEDDANTEFISAEPYFYLRVPGDPEEAGLPKGTEWARVKGKIDDEDVAAVRVFEVFTPATMPELLSTLDATVERAGSERVDGELTSRYRFRVDGNKLSAELAERFGVTDVAGVSKTTEFRFVLWVDGDKRVRRTRIRAQDKRESFTVTSQVTRYDRALKLELPRGPGVHDVSSGALI